MANTITTELDKSFQSTVTDTAGDDGTYGEMNIRVVVCRGEAHAACVGPPGTECECECHWLLPSLREPRW
jgi:hypothetical protein